MFAEFLRLVCKPHIRHTRPRTGARRLNEWGICAAKQQDRPGRQYGRERHGPGADRLQAREAAGRV